ncbi:hypothetical protein M011DRAFT_488436 [Sporormia fimetaria CBS 119925]|uniref:Transcriptional regulatory protein RXT2 N-terminal domain-containing protein n=1 Tax=Sporormia fimetaria CBS 119925 TaxID=1340428 RepID=A0A6A6V3Q0_9PLEO|nr:hypothetical protein M011DRAFT_488436 [Sporormia fimetaria CBS 119925]
MAGQQQQIIDTIFNLKKRLLRDDESSDAEESSTPYNRKQNLKRKALYARPSRADTLSNPPPYKKRIEHAGYQRYIIHRNPPRYDPDGDVIDPLEEYEDEDELSDVEENPYADIKLEELLAPLTSAADLPNHPGYSPAYTSKHLTNLMLECGAISRKERVTLARAKVLFDKMLGDPAFIPESVDNLTYGENLQSPWAGLLPSVKEPQTNGDTLGHDSTRPSTAADTPTAGDVPMPDAEQPNGVARSNAEDNTLPNGAPQAQDPKPNNHTVDERPPNGEREPTPMDDMSDTASQQAHRMTTRARAQAASDLSAPASPSSVINSVHPLFTFPKDSLPDRDFGLPHAEAEETRILLLALVQKQEEIAKAANDLYSGLLEGERMRHDVFSWCKAEAHVGEMSDGEDWYDREEWGLTEDLAKGRDEEEDDTATQGKKSTRQRRTKDKDDR